MKTTILRRVFGGLAVLTLGSSLANASSITWYNNIFNPDNHQAATSSVQGAPTLYTTPFSTTVEVPKFDPTAVPGADSTHIGHLTSVEIVLNWIMNGTVIVVNIDGTP